MKPRDFALRELDEKRLLNWRSGDLKKLKDAAPPEDPRDLALAENIVVGVVKNLLLLQHLVQYYSGRSAKSIDRVVQKILAIGLYQLRFLDRVPARAVVDEAVEQTRRFGEGRAAGFVNAVLRKATREPDPQLPGRDAAADYARLVLSHPPDLFARLVKLLGVEQAIQFCEHDQQEPPTIVRLVAGQTRDALQSDGVTITPHEQPGMFVVDGARRALLADWAARGIAQVQDPTAADVCLHLPITPGQVVLDRCCGMGTKTLQLREAVGASGKVVAIDPAEARCQALRRTLGHRKIDNVEVYSIGWLANATERIPQQFDAILADVPCSNSGVLARRPEARYFQTSQALKTLEQLQDQILADSAPRVRSGGYLLYSTCSVWPEENRARVDAFLKSHADFELVQDRSTLPSFSPEAASYRDGGYFALLRRK